MSSEVSTAQQPKSKFSFGSIFKSKSKETSTLPTTSSQTPNDTNGTIGTNGTNGTNGSINEKDAEDKDTAEKPSTVLAEAVADDKEDWVPEYPTGKRMVPIVLALCLAVFVVSLDNTIIATAIPKITDQFKSVEDVAWYAASYLLTTTALQPSFGKVYKNYSVKWTFLITVFIFEVGSLICAVAPNSTTLIIGRAIAGLGTAGIFSGALIILGYSVPLEKRPIYFGIIGGMYAISSVIGPLLGGVFTDHATWRWCFYINLPIGGITIGGIALFYQEPKRPSNTLSSAEKIKQLDLWGAAFLLPAVICLLLALQWGGNRYPWSNRNVVGLLVGFGILTIIFIVIQVLQKNNATIPIAVMKNQTVWSVSCFAIFMGAAFFILIYYVPIFFQAVRGDSATRSGVLSLPLVLSVVGFSIVAGGAVTALGYYTPFMITGTIFMTIGTSLICTWDENLGLGKLVGYQFIAGAGFGMSFQLAMIAVQNALPLDDVPVGTAIVLFFQTLGGALFVAVAQSIFTTNAYGKIGQIPNIDYPRVAAAGATELDTLDLTDDQLLAVLRAYVSGLDKAFIVAAVACGLAFLSTLAIPHLRIKKGLQAGAPAA